MVKVRSFAKKVKMWNAAIQDDLSQEAADIAQTRAFLARQSSRELIGHHCTIMAMIGGAQRERKLIEEELGRRFPGKEMYERIIESTGVAERRVTNSYVPNVEKMPALRERLGAEFSEYVDHKVVYKLDPKKVGELREILGDRSEQFFFAEDKFVATKKTSTLLRIASEKMAKMLARFFTIDSDVKISVRPVNEEAKSNDATRTGR